MDCEWNIYENLMGIWIIHGVFMGSWIIQMTYHNDVYIYNHMGISWGVFIGELPQN